MAAATGNYKEEFETALTLVKKAGQLIRDAFDKPKTVTTKSEPSDLVTPTDKLVEKFLRDGLTQEFPTTKWIGEESVGSSGVMLTESPTWVVDPVDGTTNFVHHNPHICTIVAYLVDREVQFCIIYNPILSQLWTARKGMGAFYNGIKISVSGCHALDKSLMTLQMNPMVSQEVMDKRLSNMTTFMTKVRSVRMSGASGIDLAYLAMGSVDSFLHFGHHIWDYAGPVLLVKEAGGVSMDPGGGKVDLLARKVLVAASEELARQMLPHITNIEFERDG